MFTRNQYPHTHEWFKTFAWRPRKLITGKWAWLIRLEVSSYDNENVDPEAPFDRSNRVFRLPASNTREYLHG